MAPEEAYKLLESIALISDTRDRLKWIKSSEMNYCRSVPSRRSHINFTKCGIPMGAVLVSTEGPSRLVKVIADRKVEYNNEITSLSAVAMQIKGIKSAM